MKFLTYANLSQKEKRIISMAISASKRSVSDKKHKVGCALLCKSGRIFLGATNARSRAIGSTCAERMAVDQFYFHKGKTPLMCVLIGWFDRVGWSSNFVCTPCGVCLEMFWEMLMKLKIEDLVFLCVSWNKKKILQIKLSELYPQIGKGGWRRL